MKKVELEIAALSHSITQSQSYAVVLCEKQGIRRLPIVIGAYEAQAIAVAMEKMTPSRPLTHDLLKNVCERFDVELSEVLINNLADGIFYAQLICRHKDETIEIDSRTSDALALAVRFNCPIFTFESILDSAGIVLEDSSGNPEPVTKKVPVKDRDSFASQSIEKLKEMLEAAIGKEDYELAAKIRDEMNSRS